MLRTATAPTTTSQRIKSVEVPVRAHGAFMHVCTHPYTQREHANCISDSSSSQALSTLDWHPSGSGHVIGASDSLLQTQQHSNAPTSLVPFQWLFGKHADMFPDWLDWTPEHLVTPCRWTVISAVTTSLRCSMPGNTQVPSCCLARSTLGTGEALLLSRATLLHVLWSGLRIKSAPEPASSPFVLPHGGEDGSQRRHKRLRGGQPAVYCYIICFGKTGYGAAPNTHT